MARAPIIAIADDLTGAAEIAAIGRRHGLEAIVVTDGHAPMSDADLIVFDTDSRLDPPTVATKKIAALAQLLARQPHSFVYKKTDSVLRGGVRTELETLATGIACPCVVLVPANPGLGRIVRGGRYSVGGVPLHHTTFAHDPHHPAATDSVRELLGDAGNFPIATLNSTDLLPRTGLIAGNATTRSDLDAWTRHLAAGVLPAGGAEFFAAVLTSRGLTPVARPTVFLPASPSLIVSGTASSAGMVLREAGRRDHVPVMTMPTEALRETWPVSHATLRWTEALRIQLMATGRAIAVYDGPFSSDPRTATAIRTTFATCVGALAARSALRHLIVEGGATAATITRALGWHELRLVHEWATGVASLQPAGNVPVIVTLKPGTYAWPKTLWQHVLAPQRTPHLAANRQSS